MATKKDYVAIAEIIAGNRDPHLGPGGTWRDGRDSTTESIAEGLADYFTTDNPRFDRSRFMRACGLEDK